MVDRAHVTLFHEADYICIDLCVDISFEWNIFAFRHHLIQCKFDLSMSLVNNWNEWEKKSYGSCSKSNGNTWYLVCKDFGKKVGYSVWSSVEEVNDKAQECGVSKVVCMTLRINSVLLSSKGPHVHPHLPHASRSHLDLEVFLQWWHWGDNGFWDPTDTACKCRCMLSFWGRNVSFQCLPKAKQGLSTWKHCTIHLLVWWYHLNSGATTLVNSDVRLCTCK